MIYIEAYLMASEDAKLQKLICSTRNCQVEQKKKQEKWEEQKKINMYMHGHK